MPSPRRPCTGSRCHRCRRPPWPGWRSGSGRDSTALHTLTGGNPFYVTETLAAPGDTVPATVADAVLARVGRLDPACRDAVEQLSVVPTAVELGLARQLLGPRFDALTPAEEQGVLQVRADGLAFRHELARRAVEQSLSALRRRAMHRRVIAALAEGEPRDLPRLVHHAVRADDIEAILAYAPAAGREAAAAGSHRQALAHLEAALRHAERLPDRERARLHDDHAWELHNAHRHEEAVAESERAVALFTAIAEPLALGAALVRLSRHRYLTGDTDGAEAAAEDALRTVMPLRSPGAAVRRSPSAQPPDASGVVEPGGGDAAVSRRSPSAQPVDASGVGEPGGSAVAAAAVNRGTLLALDGHPDADKALREAQVLADRAGRFDLVALCLNYESLTEPDVDVDHRIGLLRAGIELAVRHRADEAIARGYTNLSEMLYRYARFAELEEVLGAGLAFTDEHGFPSHAYNLNVHRCLLALRRGDWVDAESGLEALVDQDDDPGMLAGHSRPPYGRLLARRGVAGAGQLLALAWERALGQRSLLCLAYAGTALVEHAWLADRPDRAATVLEGWARHAARPSAEPVHAEILRYAARAGLPAEPFPGCPEPWAAGLRGDWRAAAAGWERVGDPYEQALELTASGEPAATLEALRTLEDLGAHAAVRHVRRRLRELGVTRVPRRPTADTRAHPAGLTRRQADVLALIADGLTNAEIADELVLSVRTVDTHVAAILDRLGVRSRREAASVARTLDLAEEIQPQEPRRLS